RCEANFLCELYIPFFIVARDQWARGVVQVSDVPRFPVHHAGCGAERKTRSFPTNLNGRRQNIALNDSLEVPRRMKRILAQGGKVVERIVAVLIPLAGDDQTRFPSACRRPPQLSLAVGGPS